MNPRKAALSEITVKLEAMSMVELRAIAKSADIPTPREKAKLIDYIVAAISAGSLWIPGEERLAPAPMAAGLIPTSPPNADNPDGEYSVKVRRIREAQAAGRPL